MQADKQNYAEGQTVEITVALANIASEAGLYGLSGKLSYDTSIFETITSSSTGVTEDIVSLNGWGNVTYNSSTNQFSILTTSPTKGAQSIMKIKLKVKEGATLGKATIMLNDLQASNGADDITTTAASVSVNIKDPSEVDGGEIPSIITTPTPTATPTQAPTKTPTQVPTKAPTPTPSGSKLPQTGIEDNPTVVIIGALLISLGSYIAYRRYKDI